MAHKNALFFLHFWYLLASLPNTHFASTHFLIIFHNYILLCSTYISIFSFISVYIENILIWLQIFNIALVFLRGSQSIFIDWFFYIILLGAIVLYVLNKIS